MKAVGFWQPGESTSVLEDLSLPTHPCPRGVIFDQSQGGHGVNPRDLKAGETSVPLQAIR